MSVPALYSVTAVLSIRIVVVGLMVCRLTLLPCSVTLARLNSFSPAVTPASYTPCVLIRPIVTPPRFRFTHRSLLLP